MVRADVIGCRGIKEMRKQVTVGGLADATLAGCHLEEDSSATVCGVEDASAGADGLRVDGGCDGAKHVAKRTLFGAEGWTAIVIRGWKTMLSATQPAGSLVGVSLEGRQVLSAE